MASFFFEIRRRLFFFRHRTNKKLMKPKSLSPELPVSANSGREDEVFSDGIERAKDDSARIVETQNCNGSIESRYDDDILAFRFDSKDNEEKGRRDDADRLCNETYEAPDKNVELSNDADLFFQKLRHQRKYWWI